VSHELSKFTDTIRALKQEHEQANMRRVHREEQEAAEREIYLANLNKVLSSIVEALIEGDHKVILVSPEINSSRGFCLRYGGIMSRYEYILKIEYASKAHVSLVSIFKDNRIGRRKLEVVYTDAYDEDKITKEVIKSLRQWYEIALNSTN
jgi:hypothetical protein